MPRGVCKKDPFIQISKGPMTPKSFKSAAVHAPRMGTSVSFHTCVREPADLVQLTCRPERLPGKSVSKQSQGKHGTSSLS